MADHRDGAIRPSATPVIGLGDRTTQDRSDAQDLEIAAAGPDSVDEIGFSGFGQVEPRGRPGERAVEEILPLAHRFPDGIRPSPRPVVRTNQRETVGVSYWEGTQYETVDNGEHR